MGYGGEGGGLDDLNGNLNILQSLVLPFAVVPLLTLASSTLIMGDFALSSSSKFMGWVAFVFVMIANTYLFVQQVDGVVTPQLIFGICIYIAAITTVIYATDIKG